MLHSIFKPIWHGLKLLIWIFTEMLTISPLNLTRIAHLPLTPTFDPEAPSLLINWHPTFRIDASRNLIGLQKLIKVFWLLSYATAPTYTPSIPGHFFGYRASPLMHQVKTPVTVRRPTLITQYCFLFGRLKPVEV